MRIAIYISAAIIMFCSHAEAAVTECHLRSKTENFTYPPGVNIDDEAYVCIEEKNDGSFTKIVKIKAGKSHLELLSHCKKGQAERDCKQEIQPRPSTRFADLLRFKVIDFYDWARDADRAAIDNYQYLDSLTPIYQQALDVCSNIPGASSKDDFTWVGKVAKTGVIKHSMVYPMNKVSQCVLKQLDQAKVAMPPDSYEYLDGFPVAFPTEFN